MTVSDITRTTFIVRTEFALATRDEDGRLLNETDLEDESLLELFWAAALGSFKAEIA